MFRRRGLTALGISERALGRFVAPFAPRPVGGRYVAHLPSISESRPGPSMWGVDFWRRPAEIHVTHYVMHFESIRHKRGSMRRMDILR